MNFEKNIVFLIGLPGSGKSYWLNNNVVNTTNCIIFDDISQTDPKLKNLSNALSDNNITHIYIADVNLLNIDTFIQAKTKIQQLSPTPLNFSQIVFVGDINTCKQNVELRADGRNVKGTLERFKDKVISIKNFLQYEPNTTIIEVENYLLKNQQKNKLKS